ncbi:MAG: disulfide bond formation protein B [Gemmatimonadota bacterium]|jgi:disulfide bond formation protein DsbB
MALSEERLRGLLAWLAILLLVVPVGGALWLGVAEGESPCILCWAQRTSMVLIALVALFVVRYGPRPRYVGMLVLLGAWGTFMAIRHSSLHVARDVGQGFAINIMGAHTYTWAWVIHWVVLVVGGLLLLFVRGPLSGRDGLQVGRVGRFAMGLMVVVVAANALQAFASTGPPPYLGQGDPVRLSLDPRLWVWSTGEMQGAVSWRGSWDVPEPDASDVDPDPAGGPLAGLPELSVRRWERVSAPLDGRLTGFALAPAAVPASADSAEGPVPAAPVPAVAVTEGYGVYVLDGTLSRVLHRVVLDPAFSVDLTPMVGAALLGADTLAVVSTNKSYVLLRTDSAADAEREWRHFLETDGAVTELSRSRFATMRARQMYVLSLAYDPDADELVTVGVPSPRHPSLVVSRFDRADFVLSSEFLPDLGPGLVLRDPERGLGEYVVTGATVTDGRLYAFSAAYSTLLVIDLRSETVVAAYAVPGISDPVGVATRGRELFVTQADGRIAVLEGVLPQALLRLRPRGSGPLPGG